MYLRSEAITGSAAGKSVRGTEIYGVCNDTSMTTGSLWGTLTYAYVKGKTEVTVNNMYAGQFELSWDAGRTHDCTLTTEAAVILAKVTGGRVDDYTKIHGMIIRFGEMDGDSQKFGYGIHIENDGEMSGTSTFTTGLYLEAGCDTGIDIAGSTVGMNIDGTMTYGIYINPTTTADTSMMPIRILYNYLGATNTGVDIDNFGVRSAITQTSSNAQALGKRGYIQGMRSDVTVNGYIDDAYSLYAKMTCAGASTVNQLYGTNNVLTTGSATVAMDETGNIAGVGVSINGTGDVTCGGAGYGKVSGMYINWAHTNALTVDSCGVYLGVTIGATLDSGYRVNASGSLTNSFHSMNTSGTPTNALNIEGAHTNAFAFPADSVAPMGTGAPGGASKYVDCTVGGVAARIHVQLVA